MNIIDPGSVRTKNPVDMPVLAFTKQVQVKIRDLWRKTVGVVSDVLRTMTVSPYQAVAVRHLIGRAMPGKQIGVAHALQGCAVFSDADPFSTGYKRTNQIRVGKVMFTQQAERVMVARINQTLDISRDFR